MKNIVIIGMPGAGKSTIGRILAKTLGMNFIDTDTVIRKTTGRPLQEIIDADGTGSFLETEEKTIVSLQSHNAVIATGGSVVFSARAMEHLKKTGIVVYLKISREEMERRLSNTASRGIVLFGGENLSAMYTRRVPLYEKYADTTIDCSNGRFADIAKNIIDQREKFSRVDPRHRI